MIHIKTNQSLKDYNSFGIEIKASKLITFDDANDLKELAHKNALENALILGGGSNILFVSDVHKNVIYPQIKGRKKVNETDSLIYLEFGAGEVWDDVVSYCVEEGYGGIENLSLIPGNVGAAPIQNIGAYGVELKDVIDHVVFYNIEKKTIKKLDNPACSFGYRDSIFKNELRGKVIILSVVMRLTKRAHRYNTSYAPLGDSFGEHDIISLNNIRERVIQIRKSKLPDPNVLGQGNAGSFFKNPVVNLDHYKRLKMEFKAVPSYPIDENNIKIPAAWLIQESGWKGRKVGDVQCNPLQPLVIMNIGNATGQHILEFTKLIQDDVYDLFKIKLQREVNVIA